jgi:hypothetical protein
MGDIGSRVPGVKAVLRSEVGGADWSFASFLSSEGSSFEAGARLAAAGVLTVRFAADTLPASAQSGVWVRLGVP